MAKSRQTTSSGLSWFEAMPSWKQNAIALVLMLIVVILLFNDIVLKDMIFSDSGDQAAHEAWPAAIGHIRDTENVEPLWIPYIFSGMPVAGALMFPSEVNYLQAYPLTWISKALFFGSQAHWMVFRFLLMGAGIYFLARQMKFSSTVSLFAAFVMMLNPYAVGLPETGHGSKLIVLGYIPLLFLFVYRLFEERSVLMFALTAATTGTMLLADHPQVAFYGLLFLGLYLISELIADVRHSPKAAALKTALFGGAFLIGFAMFAYHALPTLEYTPYSIRGGGSGTAATAAAGAAAVASGGGSLAYEYATNWSFHPAEMANLLVPSFFGYQNETYWGWMPFTNSTVYVGLFPLLLAGVAVAFRRNRMTWFLLAVTVFMLFISFGRYFSVVYDLMFNYFPYFNKFRIPVMILHLLPLTISLLAAFGLDWMITRFSQMKDNEIQAAKKKLLRVMIGVAVLLGVFLVLRDVVDGFFSSFCFTGPYDMAKYRQAYGAQAPQALAQIRTIRFELFWKDAVKCLILGLGFLGLVQAFLQRKMGAFAFTALITLVTIGDLWYYDVRYINPKPAAALETRVPKDPTLERLAAESAKDPFRVLDPTGQLDQYNDLMHNLIQSVEGYSPAKLQIYQDLRDSCFRNGNPAVFNMLNVKYLVMPNQRPGGGGGIMTQPNPEACPRAWFVDTVTVAPNSAAIFALLRDRTWNPRTTAILERPLAAPISPAPDSSVKLVKYASREIVLEASPAAPKLLVLSEIYYPAGWKAFIDGQETEILKTNYVLRSVVVPAGKHTISFTFHPASYEKGLLVTNAAWGLTALLLSVGAFLNPWVRSKLGLGKGEEKKA